MIQKIQERLSVGLLAGVTVITSAAQLAWAFYGILLYNCTLFTNSTIHWWDLIEVMNMIYFWNPSCRPEMRVFLRHDTIGLHFENELNPIAASTNGWMIGYATVNILLILLSILVISATCCAKTTTRRFALYCPFIAVVCFKLVMDLTSMIYYIFDIARLNTARDIIHFIGAAPTYSMPINPPDLDDFLNSFSSIRVKFSSILMMLASIQLFVVWIINLVVLIYVIKFTHGLIAKKPTSKIPVKPPRKTLPNSANNIQNTNAESSANTSNNNQTSETPPSNVVRESRQFQEPIQQRSNEPISGVRPINTERPTSVIRRYDDVDHHQMRSNVDYNHIDKAYLRRPDDHGFDMESAYPSQQRTLGFIYHPDIHQEPPQYQASPIYKPSAPVVSMI